MRFGYLRGFACPEAADWADAQGLNTSLLGSSASQNLECERRSRSEISRTALDPEIAIMAARVLMNGETVSPDCAAAVPAKHTAVTIVMNHLYIELFPSVGPGSCPSRNLHAGRAWRTSVEIPVKIRCLRDLKQGGQSPTILRSKVLLVFNGKVGAVFRGAAVIVPRILGIEPQVV